MKMLKMSAFLLPMICLLVVGAEEKQNQPAPVSHVWISKDGSIMLNGIAVQRNAIAKTLKERGISEDESILIYFARGMEVKYLLEVQAALVNAGYLWTSTRRTSASLLILGARNWDPNQVPEDIGTNAPNLHH